MRHSSRLTPGAVTFAFQKQHLEHKEVCRALCLWILSKNSFEINKLIPSYPMKIFLLLISCAFFSSSYEVCLLFLHCVSSFIFPFIVMTSMSNTFHVSVYKYMLKRSCLCCCVPIVLFWWQFWIQCLVEDPCQLHFLWKWTTYKMLALSSFMVFSSNP
jgi:hypothetical protein